MSTLTPAPSSAEAIKEIVALAGQARGIEIEQIQAPDTMKGVPSEIPIGIRHGTTPEAIGLAPLFEAFRTHPSAKRGTATALTLASFIDLVNRHKLPHSAVFADSNWRKPAFQAVIDYHAASIEDDPCQPENLKHRIRYEFPLSEEWKAWVANDGEKMSQLDFAIFLENRIRELSSPTDAERIELERDFATRVATPSELIQLSRGLQVNVDAVVKAAHTLQTGEGSIQWEETHKDASGAPVKVPGVFVLSVAPFFMGEKVRIPVRLRYRPGNGRITWFYEIYRPDIHVTERVQEDLNAVAQQTSLPTFEGSPEA